MSSSIALFLPYCSAFFDTGCCILQLTLCLPLSPLSFHTAWPLLMPDIISFLYHLFPSTLFRHQASHARIYSLLLPLSIPGIISFNWHKNISSSIAFFLLYSFDAGHYIQEYIFFYCLFWCWALYLQLTQEYIFLYHLFSSTLFQCWASYARIYHLLLPLLTLSIVSSIDARIYLPLLSLSFHTLLTPSITYKNISSSIASFDTGHCIFQLMQEYIFLYCSVPLLNILYGTSPPLSAIAQHLYLYFSLTMHC